MAVKDLHEAAVVLQGAYGALDKLLTETEPMERAFFGALSAFPGSDEDYERVAEETGYRAFTDAVWKLLELLRMVERTEIEACEGRRGAA